MKRSQAVVLISGLLLASTSCVVSAQAASDDASKSPTRKEVKAETKEFLKMHQWDAVNEAWVVKPDMVPTTGLRSRADVKKERDAYLRTHRWDDTKEAWVELSQGPRDLNALPREQVKKETVMFLKTHSYNEDQNAWVELPVGKK